MNMPLAPRELQLHLRPPQILVLGFAAVIFTGALLLSLPVSSNDGHQLRFLDALFTSTSAVCVTGLVVVDTALQFSRFGQVVILILIQTGGLGFMAFSTLLAFLIGKRISFAERLVLQEALNQISPAGIVRLMRNVFLTTLAFEGCGALILTARFAADHPFGASVFLGVFHAVSAFCNAGFDIMGGLTGKFSNLSAYVADPTVSLTVCMLIIFGGLGFPVIHELVRFRHDRRLSIHAKLVLRVTLGLLLAGTFCLFLFELANPATLRPLGLGSKVLAAFFQAVTPRTAGYNTLNIGAMRTGSIFFLILLMFIGASPSSTGGGVKTTTFGVLLASIIATIRGYDEVTISGRRLQPDLIAKAMTIAALAFFLVIAVTLVMTFTEHALFIQTLFEVVSAFGTVGLSTGITPGLSDAGRVLLIGMMFIGRLGPLTIAVALAQKKHYSRVNHIVDRVMIG